MEPITNEFPIQKSCAICVHAKTCAAYRAFSSALEQLKENYEFIEKAPFPAESLASVCSEYAPQSKVFRIEQIQNNH